jgi:hypothetical protein
VPKPESPEDRRLKDGCRNKAVRSAKIGYVEGYLKNVRPGPSTVGREVMTARFRTFSQAPQAVRSARGRRRDRMFPAGAATDRAFGADKRDPVDLTVQVHRLRHISTAAAV